MSRTISTVVDLWREYDVGIGGQPSVRSQYEGNNDSWRKGNDSERRFYSRRMIIINAVKALAKSSCQPEVDVARSMDAYRVAQQPVVSLTTLQSVITSGMHVVL